ncbi:MFS transporter [Roseibium sp. M-1]
MLKILSNRTYRHLFGAQIIALIGTGLATVALGLLAFDFAGADAGTVLGTALAIKMIAYVGVAPVAAAFAEHLPRRTMLVSLDFVRAGIAVLLPFVTEVWQIYVLIFLLQSTSAAFTPTFQATIPDILSDEKEYTKALSLSRLAYDLESLASPMLAVFLLTLVSFPALFAGTVIGFLASAVLIVSVLLPNPRPSTPRPIFERTMRGLRIYLATPRLRGLLAVNMAVATTGAMIVVNTVVIVQGTFGLLQQSTALALAAFGGGSMVAALTLPRLLETISDRTAMFTGVAIMVAGLIAGTVVAGIATLLSLWFVIGIGYSAAQTPSGRLLRRSSHPEDRPALFATQFALSHACWLVTYPLAGWLGAAIGLSPTFVVLAFISMAALLTGMFHWQTPDDGYLLHMHPELPNNHPHWISEGNIDGIRHAHAYVIDDLHPIWPPTSKRRY